MSRPKQLFWLVRGSGAPGVAADRVRSPSAKRAAERWATDHKFLDSRATYEIIVCPDGDKSGLGELFQVKARHQVIWEALEGEGR